MSNEELQENVTDELRWDPKINSSIAVGADGGTVTLRGTVGSFREKRAAKKAAERVYGVTAVQNELSVLTRPSRESRASPETAAWRSKLC